LPVTRPAAAAPILIPARERSMSISA